MPGMIQLLVYTKFFTPSLKKKNLLYIYGITVIHMYILMIFQYKGINKSLT